MTPSNTRPLIIAALPNFSRTLSIACSAWAARIDCWFTRSAASAAPSLRFEAPMPIRRNFVPSVSRRSRSRPASKMRAAKLRRLAERAGAGAQAEIRGLQLQRDGRARNAARLQPRRDPLGERPERLLQRLVVGDILVERRLGRHAFGLALRVHAAVVDAAREPPQPAPLDAVAAHQVGLVGLLQVRDGVVAVALQPRLRRLADAPDEADRLVARKRRLVLAEHRKAARLVEVGGDLGEELVGRSPIETVMPMSSSTRLAKRASARAGLMRCSRSVPVRSMKASSIESGSTCGVSSSISWRTSRPTRTYFAMLGVITVACGQSLQRLEHRHRGVHAVGARDVAGGRDHAALAAADDQRLVGERRIVALLDRGVEGVAVDMRDRRARRAARGGSAAASRRPCSAARFRHRRGSRGRSRACPRGCVMADAWARAGRIR